VLGAVDARGRTCSESEKRKRIGGAAGTFLRNSERIRSAMPGSPIQEQIRAWIQICGRKVACLQKSQKNETSRPTFASSYLGKPPKGGFFLILPPSLPLSKAPSRGVLFFLPSVAENENSVRKNGSPRTRIWRTWVPTGINTARAAGKKPMSFSRANSAVIRRAATWPPTGAWQRTTTSKNQIGFQKKGADLMTGLPPFLSGIWHGTLP